MHIKRLIFASMAPVLLVALLTSPSSAQRGRGHRRPRAAAAGSQTARQETCPLSEAESSVLSQLKTEGKADLGRLPDDKRVIKACFLKRLLTDSVKGLKLDSSGVHIKNAVIDGSLELYNEKIPYSVSLISCDFKSAVIFYHVNIAGDLNFSNDFVPFPTSEKHRNDCPGTIFRGQVLFINVAINGDLEATNCKFLWQPASPLNDVTPSSEVDAADFEEVKVSNDAFFNGVIFEGPADFEGAHFGQVFWAKRAHFNYPADFIDVIVSDDLELNGASFASAADFSRAKINNEFGIDGVSFNDQGERVVFHDMHAGRLTLDDKTTFAGTPHLDGMTYERIDALDKGNNEEGWKRWLTLLEKSQYRVDAYTALEAFINRQGQPGAANEVYISQRDREAGEAFKTSKLRGTFMWCWDFFVKWTVGYGRRPWLALIYSIVVVILGCVAFPLPQMHFQKISEKQPPYNRLWYSLDLFLPVVDLHNSEFWMPNKGWRWHYMHLHALFGWLLVPIGLAALTGIIK